MTIKRDLARRVVSLYYSDEIALQAEYHFNKVVVSKGIPNEMPEYNIISEELIVNVIYESGLLESKSAARRMIKQGAVKLDGETIQDIQLKIQPKDQQILKVGKRRFLKVTK